MALSLFQLNYLNGQKIKKVNLNLSHWENRHKMPMWHDLTGRSEAILNRYVFNNFTEVRDRTETWIRKYNEERLHDSFNHMTLWEHLVKFEQQKNAN